MIAVFQDRFGGEWTADEDHPGHLVSTTEERLPAHTLILDRGYRDGRGDGYLRLYLDEEARYVPGVV